MSDYILVRNLTSSVLKVTGNYVARGLNTQITVPVGYIQGNSEAITSLSALITNRSIQATYNGVALTATDVANLSSTRLYWEESYALDDKLGGNGTLGVAVDALSGGTVALSTSSRAKTLSAAVATLRTVRPGTGESLTVDILKIDPTTGTAATLLNTTPVLDETTVANAAAYIDFSDNIKVDNNWNTVDLGWTTILQFVYVPGTRRASGLVVTLGWTALG